MSHNDTIHYQDIQIIKKEREVSDHKIFPIRIDQDMYQDLRKISFLTHISMADIIREGAENKIKEYKKMLTHTEISV